MGTLISKDNIEREIRSIHDENLRSNREYDQAFQDAACVLFYFNPDLLHASVNLKQLKGWSNFFSYCSPVKTKTAGNHWELRPDIRRDALKRLGSREKMLKALLLNPERSTGVAQKLFDSVLQGTLTDPQSMKREELVTLSGILEWLIGILPISEIASSIQKAIPVADLLSPMRKLATENFVGREDELKRLADYVGIKPTSGLIRTGERFVRNLFYDLTSYPPLLIHGPGGLGKSTLLAKFILTHAENVESGALPFIYLDIDRVVLDPERPHTFIMDAARQLINQCPEQKDPLFKLKESIERYLFSYDSGELSKSINQSASFYEDFGSIINSIKTPVLLVVDTFEEAQYLGFEVVSGIWKMLVTLQKVAPNLRTVVSGRSVVKEFPVKELPLSELGKDDARKMLQKSLGTMKLSKSVLSKVIDEIIDVVGLNPFSIRLAANIVIEQGIEKLRKVETKSWLILRVRSEIVQARLYGRILAHLHNQNEKVKNLAYPGLIVRRITPEIIMEVLAIPCKVKIDSIKEAQELFDELATEIALVEPDGSGALLHRQNVRKIMLADLKNDVPEQVIREIHDRAVAYYSARNDIDSKAEEIYHRLSRGDDPKTIEIPWQSDFGSRLRSALDEMPVESRLWLSQKLGVTPHADLIKRADLENWEEITSVAAQRLLQDGNVKEALKMIRTRKERTPASKLFRIELEALRLSGSYKTASILVNEYLAKAMSSSKIDVIRELFMQAAFISEALSLIDQAISYVKEAEKMLGINPQPLEALRIYVTYIRLLRKKDGDHDEERAIWINKARELLSDDLLINSLRSSPALLKEVVAELGKIMPEILKRAIDWVGIDIWNDEQVNTLSNALLEWNTELQQHSESNIGELAERAGISENNLNQWVKYVEANKGSSLINNIQHWRAELSPSQLENSPSSSFDRALVDIFRNNVETSINRTLLE